MPLVEPSPGRFCWFELGTTDRLAAIDFYKNLFGWTSVDAPGQAGIYTLLKIGNHDVAAAYELSPAMRAEGVGAAWTLYISVPDADLATTKASSLGAKLLMGPLEAGPNGRMSILQDPTGAKFSIWQGKANPGVRLVGDPGTAVWADLSTGDPMHAVAFYQQLFGWKLVADKSMAPAQVGHYAHIVNGGTFMGGIPPAEYRDPKIPPHWLIYFKVRDGASAVESVRALSGRVHTGLREIDGLRRFAVVSDPQGATFAVVE